MNYTLVSLVNNCNEIYEFLNKKDKKLLDNRDKNIQKKNKNLKYSQEKFCDRFLKK